MKKWSLICLFVLAISMMMLVPLSVNAIGQETPTPPPYQPTAQPLPSTPRAPLPTPFVPVLTPTAQFGDFSANISTARNALNNGDFETALSEINTVLQAYPYDMQALRLRADIYTYQGDYDLAIDDYNDMIRQEAWNWNLLRDRAYLYSYKGDYGSAIADMSLAISIRPTDDELFLDRYNFYYSNQQYEYGDLDYFYYDATNSRSFDQLLSVAQLAQSLDPQVQSFALAQLSSLYLSEGNLAESIKYADEALAIRPNFEYAYLLRGIAYYSDGNYVQAGFDYLGYIQNSQTDLDEMSLTFGQPYTLNMSFGKTYLVRFSAQQGDKLTFSLIGNGVDPIMVILRANGEALYGVDDNLGAVDIFLENYEMPEGGNFTLVVSHAFGGWDGDISLTVVKN
jgi:tetratricopeptide (TPR) repeat protein